jgi:hypothetical protein
MLGFLFGPGMPPAPTTSGTADWIAVVVVAALVVAAFAVYGFFVLRKKNRTAAPPAEDHVELPKAA